MGVVEVVWMWGDLIRIAINGTINEFISIELRSNWVCSWIACDAWNCILCLRSDWIHLYAKKKKIDTAKYEHKFQCFSTLLATKTITRRESAQRNRWIHWLLLMDNELVGNWKGKSYDSRFQFEEGELRPKLMEFLFCLLLPNYYRLRHGYQSSINPFALMGAPIVNLEHRTKSIRSRFIDSIRLKGVNWWKSV